MSKIVLASSSPRRIEILRRVGFERVKVIPPRVNETMHKNMPPEDSVAYWSREKALDVAAQVNPDDIVIAADTIVWFDGNVLGKPVDKTDAFNMLTMLSGNWHSVYTGVTVVKGDKLVTEEEITSVLFRSLSSSEIERYVETGEPLDKAGGYGVQERGALLCERIDGDFYNVMGLPVFRLSLMLAGFGIDMLKGEE